VAEFELTLAGNAVKLRKHKAQSQAENHHKQSRPLIRVSNGEHRQLARAHNRLSDI